MPLPQHSLLGVLLLVQLLSFGQPIPASGPLPQQARSTGQDALPPEMQRYAANAAGAGDPDDGAGSPYDEEGPGALLEGKMMSEAAAKQEAKSIPDRVEDRFHLFSKKSVTVPGDDLYWGLQRLPPSLRRALTLVLFQNYKLNVT